MIPFYHSLSPDAISGSELDFLLAHGWYRMHQSIFTSSHLHLEESYRVHWLRYPLAEIKNRPSHKRIRNRAKDFRYSIEELDSIRPDHEALYTTYRKSIDFDGAYSIHQSLFGEEDTGKNIFKTKCISVYDQDSLIAGGYFDVGATSAASILHFFDPLYKDYSLGKFLMLLTVDFLRSSKYEFYYPGYLVAGIDKMNYKLFIGKEATHYFDPKTISWKHFQQNILLG
ncbi:MAG: arginine-tRNA-protein transferase [Cyclobacteriaceae bacterium]